MKANQFNLLFFGSDSFSIIILKHLLGANLCPVQVVTKPFSLVDKFSAHHRISRHRWPLDLLDSTIKDRFNIGLVASFGQLIDVNTINSFKNGLFNVHPSLLPQYRGSTPIQTAILDGVKETGCTIMRIPPIDKFDIGDIILQERVEIERREYASKLRDRLATIGACMTERLLNNYDECLSFAKPQGDSGRSYAKKLKLEQGLINFKSESATRVDHKVRAFTGFLELYTYCLGGLKIRLEDMRDPSEVERYDLNNLAINQSRLKSAIDEDNTDVPAGTIFFHKVRHVVCIKCSDNKWAVFDYITPEFKPRMSGLDFYNGYLSKVGPDRMKTDT